MAAQFSFASRRLSDYETVLDLLRTRGDGVLCHVMIVRTKTEITKAKLVDAVKSLMHHQPALRMRVSTERGANGLSKRFVERDDVIIDVTEASDADCLWDVCLQQTCSELLATPGGQLWKLIYMDVGARYAPCVGGGHVYAIVFKISNVIADHVSIYLLLTRQLRMILIGSQLASGCTVCKVPLHVKPSVDQCFAPTQVAPSVGKRQKNRSSSVSCLTSATRRRRRRRRRRDESSSSVFGRNSLLSELNDMTATPRTKLGRCVLGSNDARRLVRLCRRHGVRIELPFVVASAHAYYIALRGQRLALDDAHVRVCHWLDLRRYHGAPSDCDPLGMWLCPVYTKHKPAANGPTHAGFWKRVRKLSADLAPEREPWKRGFQEFRKCLDEVNKTRSGQDDDDGDDDHQAALPIPRCHVSVSSLEVELDTEEQMIAMAKSRHGHVPDGFDPMIVLEYHFTSCVTSQSISLLNVSVVRDKENVSFIVSRDDNIVPFIVGEKFLAILAKIISHMVRGGLSSRLSRSASYSSAKLPDSAATARKTDG